MDAEGRAQVMAYGSERLISARYGPNVLRSFDGALLSSQSPRVRVDAFFVRPGRNALGSFNDHADRERRLWGLYVTLSEPARVPDTGVDLYYLGLSNAHARYNQGSGPETRHTLGVRYFGERYGWSWDHEGIYQFGNFAGAAARAWSVASDVRYTLMTSAGVLESASRLRPSAVIGIPTTPNSKPSMSISRGESTSGRRG